MICPTDLKQFSDLNKICQSKAMERNPSASQPLKFGTPMSVFRSAVKAWLMSHDMVLSRPPGQFSVTDHKLRLMRRRGFEVHCAVDGGAADGGWTRQLKAVYPDAQVLCIEPRDSVQPALAELNLTFRGIHVKHVAAGPTAGMVQLYEHGDQSSTFAASVTGPMGPQVAVPAATIDELISEARLPWPDLIKLDLQAAELDALRGAAEVLVRHKLCCWRSVLSLLCRGPL